MGTFGYVYRRKTKYACCDSGGAKSNYGTQTTDGRSEGVAKSNYDSLGRGLGPTNGSNTALGRDNENTDLGAVNRLEISRVGYRRTGRDKSESNADEQDRQITDEDYGNSHK